MLGQVRWAGREPVGEGGDGLSCDHEVFETGLGFPKAVVQFGDLTAEVVGQGPGGVFLDAEGIKEGLEVHAATTRGSRQVGVFSPVSRRAITWVMAQ